MYTYYFPLHFNSRCTSRNGFKIKTFFSKPASLMVLALRAFLAGHNIFNI